MAKPNCEASASSDSDGSDDLVDSERVKQKAIALGFHQVGIATISDQPTAAEQSAKTALAAWLAQGWISGGYGLDGKR